MAKSNVAQLLCLIIATGCMFVATTTNSFGSTYYISTIGSDSNDGTTNSTPWLHAPGMSNCSAACSAATPKPGDRFIFRGGETWHTSNGPVIGLPWIWTWSGTSTEPIYVGVDKTWFAARAWSRPVLDMDNPLSTDRPERCTYDDTDVTAVSLKDVHYVNFDNFEFTGKCWGGNPHAASLFRSGSNITISNSYFHGWTMTAHAGDDTHYMILGAGGGITNNVVVGNVFDGSDSSLGKTPKKASGFAIYAECYDVHQNIFRRVSNGPVCSNLTYVHDNLFEQMYNPMEKNFHHGNVVESLGGLEEGSTYFYNNVVRQTDEGVTIWLQGHVLYNFNNVFYDIGNPTNCLMQNPPGFRAGTGSATSHIYNNTFVSPCNLRFSAANNTTPSWSGSVYFANNHFIGFSSLPASTDCRASTSCEIHDKGNNLFQNKPKANAEGYSPASAYAPTSTNGGTVGGGLNLFAMCETIPALCSTTSLGVTDGAENTVAYPAIPILPRSSSDSWNVGAY